MTRPQFIKVRVTEDEKARYEALAVSLGVTLSDLIRRRLDSMRVRPAVLERERNRQLARIGSNLNQLARWANANKNVMEAVRVIAGLEAIRRDMETFGQEAPLEEGHAD